MVRVKYISAEGDEIDVELNSSDTLMVGAINNGVDGIVGECGGICSCATCHVYIDEHWLDKIPAIDFMEEARLNYAIDRKENSRLACQIDVHEDLDGLVVTMPLRQY